MFGEVLTVLEIELFLSAFLGWASGRVAVRRSVAENGCTELLINQDSSFFLGHARLQRGLEAIVDDLLCGGDFCRLTRAKRAGPAKHLGLERSTVVERQDI